MKVMAKQATNRVSTLKLPDDRYPQTGRETLKELFRAHFPYSKFTDYSDNGHGQLNLDVFRKRTKRRDWNLARNVTSQSNIRWVLDMFKPFKSVGTDELVPAILWQVMEHLVRHFCCIFRAYLAYGYIPMAWRQVKVMFIPGLGNLTILRLRLVIFPLEDNGKVG
jgi:hypothetical protein